MPRIRVDPDTLRALSAEWQRKAGEIQSAAGRAGGALAGLDWEARQAAGADGEWGRARSLASNLAAEAERMARYLASKAQTFDEADRGGSAVMGSVLGAFTDAQKAWSGWWSQMNGVMSFPQSFVQQILKLGSQLGQAPAAVLASLAGLTGLAGVFGGQRTLRPVDPNWEKKVTWATPPGPKTEATISATITSAVAPGTGTLPPGMPTGSLTLTDGRSVLPGQLDGRTPIKGLDSTYGKPGQLPLQAPITSVPGQRDPRLTNAVLNQFGVEGSKRYTRDTFTYCNTYAGDVMRAMGAPLPTKADMGKVGDRATLAAQPLHTWLTTSSSERGWREVDPSTPEGLKELVAHANAGKPAIASSTGHVAVIRPDQSAQSAADLRIAQAGAQNRNDIPLSTGFGGEKPRYFIHD